MKLSVVIPTKNEEQLLPRLLATIREQAFSDYEVILADAFSTDRTRAIAASYGARVVDGGMPGPGRNRGASQATGDILLFLDADTELPHPNYFVDTLREMEEAACDVATCSLDPDSDALLDRVFHAVYNGYTRLTERLRPHAPGTCFFIRRSAHEALGGFDESVLFAEDHEYAQRAHAAGYRFRILRSHPIRVSVRRLEKDGRFSIARKFIYGELYMMFKGPFRHMPFRYEMGGDDPAKS